MWPVAKQQNEDSGACDSSQSVQPHDRSPAVEIGCGIVGNGPPLAAVGPGEHELNGQDRRDGSAQSSSDGDDCAGCTAPGCRDPATYDAGSQWIRAGFEQPAGQSQDQQGGECAGEGKQRGGERPKKDVDSEGPAGAPAITQPASGQLSQCVGQEEGSEDIIQFRFGDPQIFCDSFSGGTDADPVKIQQYGSECGQQNHQPANFCWLLFGLRNRRSCRVHDEACQSVGFSQGKSGRRRCWNINSVRSAVVTPVVLIRINWLQAGA